MFPKSLNSITLRFLTIIILFQFTMGAATDAPKVELDDQGRPLWEAGMIWVKVKSDVPLDRSQLRISSFNIPSLDAKLDNYGINDITRTFRPIERPDRKDLPDLTRIFTLHLPVGMNANALVQILNKESSIEYAERVPAMYQEAVPNDAFYSTDLYHLPQIMAEEAWDIHKGEDGIEDVVIGISDTGVDWKHPDLGANIYNRLGEDADGDGLTILWDGTEWIMDPDDLNGIDDDGNGYIDDLIGWNIMADVEGNENNDPRDPPNRGHGSHVAGLAAGVTNNETGIASISWNVKILGISQGFLGDNGTSIYRAYEGPVYLADNGADIINTSWGGGGYSQAGEEVIRYVTGLGVLFVSSAGNGNNFNNGYPASYPGSISVASVGRGDIRASYSTYGWAVDIAAPGGDFNPGLLSTVPSGSGYAAFSGTSMASPVAAGMFALLKSYNPDWTNDQLINQVIGTTDNIDGLNRDYSNWLGSGRINAYRALSEENVSIPDRLELELFDVIVSNPSAEDGVMLPGESTDISFVLRSYTHVLTDSAATFTLACDDPDIIITNASFLDTIFADDYSTIGSFNISIDEDANTEASPLWLIIDPQTAEVVTGDSIRLDLLVNTTSLSESFLDLDLTFGDIDTSIVTVSNSTSTPVTISAASWGIDPQSVLWHVDNNNAYDGTSWWCANPGIGGYPDATIQYMDLPELDLSTTTNPQLSFMVDWYIEDPAGAEAPYDGWDGANIWISTDGGDSFEVIEPISPAYTSTALFSWGEFWGIGIVPGWAGDNNGYVEALFDLSSYTSENVVVRFGFASDGSATDIGIFVDDITVSDDATVLFENSGVFGGGIALDGFPVNTIATPWLEFPNADNSVPGNGDFELEIVTNTTELQPGFHNTTAYVMYESFVLGAVDVSLSLSAPEHDISLEQAGINSGNFVILHEDSVVVLIGNKGANTEYDFDLTLNLSNADGLVYTNTVTVDSLHPGVFNHFFFAPYLPLKGEALGMEVIVSNVVDDYNSYNDAITDELIVENKIEAWAEANDAWDMGGWGVTAGIVGIGDIYAVHVDNGQIPYSPNLDNKLAYIAPINLSQIENLALVYNTVSQTEAGIDVMTLEVSTDQVSWDVLRSHSGAASNWVEHAVDLSSYVTAGNEELWFRFHFVSNESVAGMGLFVDDISLYTHDYLGVNEPISALPQEFELNQNYPNPFNPSTTISYALPSETSVHIQIFDVRGRMVNTLVNTQQAAGYYDIDWRATDLKGNPLGTGVYLARIQAGDYSKVIKMLYLK
ncbi:MAG: S8 family serine peptidase [Candidatus Marinimicrobia bacterium]|nr:S8 family serine peptidase [Candidatus Neomarinimicrobiota bacterium]MBT4419450.1 S8 family serine peptidase [Candidatus Neomarinimicrobiota bacterium]MBT4993932.1 S8 family serine peptidase [Candidatus Neomarinimicrobiota bacterium]MBT5466643.1 S8 family serine peptidase [Candidatus Neomarinimicrobiota bacterium]MBT6002620.1 S8 family serine peptidase [Candidatus Neomarinimicrobiota bacterium]